MGPIRYDIDVQTPFQAAMQGYQAGAAIRDDQQQQAAKQAAAQSQQAMQRDLRDLSMNPNATGADYAAMTTRYPGLSEQLTRSWNTLDETQKQNKLSEGTRVYAAIQSGRPDIAGRLLRESAAAKRNSGNEQDAARDEALAQTVEQNPIVGKNMLGMGLSAIMGGKDFANTFATVQKNERDAAAAPDEQRKVSAEADLKEAEAGAAPERLATDIANVKDQIADRSRRLGLDADKLLTETQMKMFELRQKNGEIPEFVVKDMTAATTDAMSAEQSAGKMEQLAEQLQKEGGGYGALSTAGEWMKKATGNQNEMTRLRAEYNRIVTPAAMSAYKKVATGSTSDRDIDTAMKGVPSDTADASEMSAFLRGVAKLQRIDATVNNAKSEWLGAVKNLGKAKTDIEVDGVRVPAGTTFKNFVDQYVENKMAKQSAERGQKAVQGRSYLRFGQPQQPQPAAPSGPGMPGILPVTGGL